MLNFTREIRRQDKILVISFNNDREILFGNTAIEDINGSIKSGTADNIRLGKRFCKMFPIRLYFRMKSKNMSHPLIGKLNRSESR